MTTKGFLCKQDIIPMKDVSANNFIKDLSMYFFNINWSLKNIKSNTMADYIHINSKGIIITTNNVTSSSDLQAIEKYIKSMSSVDTDQVQSPRLPQSKSYLKIVRIPYLSEATNMLWDALDMNNFYFLFLLFSDFIGILFSFSFSFLLDNEEAYDIKVTWQVTWCNVISLEHGRRN